MKKKIQKIQRNHRKYGLFQKHSKFHKMKPRVIMIFGMLCIFIKLQVALFVYCWIFFSELHIYIWKNQFH
jgi:hypothetical protein